MERLKPFKNIFKNFDYILLALAVGASVFGILLINSATYHVSGAVSRDVVIQTLALVLGIIAMLVVVFIDYNYYDSLSKVIFGISVAILVLVLIIGIGKEEVGTKGWINLGPVSLQPAELAKIGFILSFSSHLAAVREEMNRPAVMLRLCLHAAVFIGLVLLQPDWGTAMVFGSIFICMMVVAGVSGKYILAAGGVFAVAAPILWFFVLKDYQINRFLVFLNPESDPLDKGYQVLQSKMAIGSGQLLGNGYMQGTQTQMGYLPQSRTDFIYAVAGEEFGFLGAIIILAVLVFLVVRCIGAARCAKDSYGELICVGVAGMLLFHVFENIGMCLGLMPVTGIPLPFFSYGGSSLITNFIAVGLVINVQMRRKVINF